HNTAFVSNIRSEERHPCRGCGRAWRERAASAAGIRLARLPAIMRRMRKPSTLAAAALGLLVACWSAGCGKKTEAKADGGDGSVTLGDAPVVGRRAFNVVAVLKADGGVSNVPQTNSFTLVLDVAAGLAIAGANGSGEIVGVSSADGRTFHSAGAFTASAGDGSGCSSATQVRYDNFEFSL